MYAVIFAQQFGSRSYALRDLSRGMAYPSDELIEESSYISQKLEDLEPSTLVNLWSANPRAVAIPANLQLGAPYSLIDQDTLATLVKSDPNDWQGFFERFPDAPGVLTIAHVGFDSAGKQALAFLEWRAGSLAGWWRYYLLRWTGTGWTIVDDVTTLVS